MWLFTQYGFFSVVTARPDLTRENPGDQMMIRARVRNHLVNLQNRFKELAVDSIRENVGTDYRYRIIVPKAFWVTVATALSEEITYPDFKGNCVIKEDLDPSYLDCLHDVWDRMRVLQAEEQG